MKGKKKKLNNKSDLHYLTTGTQFELSLQNKTKNNNNKFVFTMSIQ